MAAVKRTPIDDLQTVIKQNIFIQYALIVPVVATFIWLFGFYSAWGSIFVVALGYSVRLVASEKKHFYSLFSDKTPLTRNKSEIQHCAWLNLLLKKYWTTCVPKFVEPQIEKVNGIMLEKKPGFMKKLEIGSWQMGDRAPRITQIYTPVILSEDRFEMQFEILFVPDLNAEVHVQPHEKILLKVLGSEIKFKAKMKLSFYFNDLFPECSIVGIEFMENPLIELSVRPTSKLDLVSAPFVYQLIQEILKSNLGPMLVTPNRLQFTLGGGQVETYELMEKPITDIIIIYSETSKAPPGYFLLQRTCSGMLAANLNAGNEGKHLYICYSRDENKQPITAVCVMYPRVDIKPPQGFEVLLETPSAEPASLNIGNKGEECFLCISRAPGAPITGLALVNESEDYILPEDFKILELSVTGHKANLNKKTIGDRLFLAFKGGYDSFFGYPRVSENPAVGTLRVELIEAKNLIAADITGTSDPYAELIIGEATPKKGSLRKISSVVDKTLDPQWKENFVFTNVNVNSILTVNIYDKDAIEINPELIGRVQLPLNDLVIGKPVKQWVPLQMVSHGEVLLSITALDFGHPADQDVRVIKAIDPVSKYSANGLMGNLAGVGGMGIKGIKGVANFGAGVGGMGVKGVTNVGEMGLKGVTNVGEMGMKGVTNVGEMGMKGVTNVGEMGVKGVTNVGEMGMKAVTGLFGSRSRSKKSINVDAEGNEKPKEKKEKSKGHKGLLTSKSRKKTDPPTDAGKESKQSEPEVATIPENKVEPAENSGEASVEVSRQPIVREGVLEKHSNMIKKLSMQSKKRFCVLKSEAFNVFKSQKDFTHGDSPHESFPLGMVTINQSKSLHSFDLIDAKHHHHTFKCASDEDLQLWMSALTNNKRCLSDVQ